MGRHARIVLPARPVKLAVFDIDGTLTLPYPAEDAAYVHALREVFGIGDANTDWTGYPDVTDSGLVREVCRRVRGHEPSPEETAHFRGVYCAELERRAGAGDGGEIAGARRFLESIAARTDWRIALATGNFRRLATLKLKRAELPCLDAPLATADDAPARAELVRLAIARAEERAGAFDRVVCIGDAPWDLAAARALGLPFVAVGARCGAPAGSSIEDYADPDAVLAALERAWSW